MSRPDRSAVSAPWIAHLNKCCTSLLPVRLLQRLPYGLASLPLLASLIFLYLGVVLPHCTAAPAALHLGAPSSASSSANTRILIWPDEIEDNALAEQNGDFVYKKATAAEKQEQKSSSSIFFWPSSHGGHYNHQHRNSRNSAPPDLPCTVLLLFCLVVSWLLLRR